MLSLSPDIFESKHRNQIEAFTWPGSASRACCCTNEEPQMDCNLFWLACSLIWMSCWSGLSSLTFSTSSHFTWILEILIEIEGGWNPVSGVPTFIIVNVNNVRYLYCTTGPTLLGAINKSPFRHPIQGGRSAEVVLLKKKNSYFKKNNQHFPAWKGSVLLFSIGKPYLYLVI